MSRILAENNALSHTEKDNLIKITIRFLILLLETIRTLKIEQSIFNLPKTIQLIFAEFDHKKSTTTEADDKTQK